MNKITVNTINGPLYVTSKNDQIILDFSRDLSSSDARAVANALNKMADSIGQAPSVKPIRDPHSLLLVLVECMSTFDDNDPASIERTQAALLEYERSGDHNHGNWPVAPGAKCMWPGYCWVERVRAELAALKKVK